MSLLDTALDGVMETPGAIGVAVADSGTARSIRERGQVALVRHAVALHALLQGDALDHPDAPPLLEDALLTFPTEYYVLRPLLTDKGRGVLFLYFALDRATGNLVLARRKVAEIAATLATDAEIVQEAEQAQQQMERAESEPPTRMEEPTAEPTPERTAERTAQPTAERESVQELPEFVASRRQQGERLSIEQMPDMGLQKRADEASDDFDDDMAPYLQDDVVLKLLGLQ